MFQLINRLPTCYEIVSGAKKTEEWEIAAENALQDMKPILEHQVHQTRFSEANLNSLKDPDSRFLDNSDDSNLVPSDDDLDSNSEEESEVRNCRHRFQFSFTDWDLGTE